jgi:hypothetical protein
MGFYQSHDIGFYIVMHKHPTITETYEETRCTNSECENHKKELGEGVNFCPKCGSKVDWQDVVETHKYDFLDEKVEALNDDLHDWFFTVEYIDLLLTGVYEKLELEKDQEVIICNKHIEANDKQEFKRHPAVKALLERIGECDIHYGLVLYQS